MEVSDPGALNLLDIDSGTTTQLQPTPSKCWWHHIDSEHRSQERIKTHFLLFRRLSNKMHFLSSPLPRSATHTQKDPGTELLGMQPRHRHCKTAAVLRAIGAEEAVPSRRGRPFSAEETGQAPFDSQRPEFFARLRDADHDADVRPAALSP